jgi:serine/threonine protein kinase
MCLGVTYHGKGADTWAVGVTLYCMVLGCYPFLGDGLQDTYEQVINFDMHRFLNPLKVPWSTNISFWVWLGKQGFSFLINDFNLAMLVYKSRLLTIHWLCRTTSIPY